MFDGRINRVEVRRFMLNPTDQNVAVEQTKFTGNLPAVLVITGSVIDLWRQDRQML
jgi:hypothetical protein